MARKSKTQKRRQRSLLVGRVVRILFAAVLLYIGADALYQEYQERQEYKAEIAALVEAEKDGFISLIAPIAVAMQNIYGTRPSISIAQAILESDWGESELAYQYNNLYGVKGGEEPYTVTLSTSEYVDGEWVTIDDSFRTYDSWASSIEDHARLMLEGTTWDANQYQGVVEATSYQEAAHALQESGYATDPGYPEKLITLIEHYDLSKYDLP